jgi:HD-GYP domain-containing protein (c-di-GMP phosphodiesterase class II)
VWLWSNPWTDSQGDEKLHRSQLRRSQDGVASGHFNSSKLSFLLNCPELRTDYSLLSALEPSTALHSFRVRDLLRDWIRHADGELQLSDEDRHWVCVSGLLHDIGKLSVDRDILLKPGPLSAGERARMEAHVGLGVDFIRGRYPIRVLEFMRAHHERLDGTGYPQGLKGAEIPTGARMISIVDSYDAMTSDRPYRTALSVEIAVSELEKGQGTQFCERLTPSFIRFIRADDCST